MKKTGIVFLSLLTLCSSAFAQIKGGNLQIVDCVSLNFVSSSFNVEGGNMQFKSNSTVDVEMSVVDKKGAIISMEIGLLVYDDKGNKTKFTSAAKLNVKTGLFEAQIKLSSKYDADFVGGEANCDLLNTSGDKRSVTQSLAKDADFTNFEILLNGHKRPAKYGQCWVFASTSSNSSSFIDLKDLDVECTISKDANGKPIFGAVLGLNTTQNDKAVPLSDVLEWGQVSAIAVVTISNDEGQSYTMKIQPRGLFGKWTFDDSRSIDNSKTPWNISNIDFQFTNSCKETFDVKTEYKKGRDNSTWSFHVWNERWKINQTRYDNFAIDIVSVGRGDIKGTFGITFEFAFESGSATPKSVVTIAEIVNCKGEVKYIEIKMTYNAKTGNWYGAEQFTQVKECIWALSNMRTKVTNDAGDVIYFKPKKKPEVRTTTMEFLVEDFRYKVDHK